MKFVARVETNNLLYQKEISQRQILLSRIIKHFNEELNIGHRTICSILNKHGIRTHHGKKWSKSGSSSYSVIKRMNEREDRIKNVRKKKFGIQVSDFEIEFGNWYSVQKRGQILPSLNPVPTITHFYNFEVCK